MLTAIYGLVFLRTTDTKRTQNGQTLPLKSNTLALKTDKHSPSKVTHPPVKTDTDVVHLYLGI